MPKNRLNGWWKYIAVIISVIILFASIVAGWTKLNAKQGEFERIGTPLARENKDRVTRVEVNQEYIVKELAAVRTEQTTGFKEIKALLKDE